MSDMPSVLIIDDDAAARTLLRGILKILECEQIKEVTTGEETLETYNTYHSGILFLDIHMKGQDGLQTLKQVLEQDQQAFVVMMSADSTMENIKGAMDSGAKGFIAKPYTMAKVEEMLIKCKQEKFGQAA